MGAGGGPLPGPGRWVQVPTHWKRQALPKTSGCQPPAQPGPGMVGGRRESEAGLGVPGKQGCADVTGRAIWLERFKKGACERRCCCTQLRPPAAATTLTATAATSERGLPRPVGPRFSARSPRGYDPADAHWGCRRLVSCRSRWRRARSASVLHQPRRCPLQAPCSLLPVSGTMDTSCVHMLLSLLALLQLVAAGSSPGPDAIPRGCPSHCHCELDGRMLLRVDCSDLGLSELPSNLSVFTSYL